MIGIVLGVLLLVLLVVVVVIVVASRIRRTKERGNKGQLRVFLFESNNLIILAHNSGGTDIGTNDIESRRQQLCIGGGRRASERRLRETAAAPQ
jgi:hypothetical protein